ncbi:ThiF family adenylyltransferase [Robertmurraya yapensis]|uniref:ThiF family adenylyltransferase n=1 Tax=Bacillus yapensis TaxID=2492960 RepID=A0A3S0KH67_9BACI|nr:ThiF family adenylyltransferase [Bacillus yapensis]RTR26711.1 ThiF family adenylyltransferase [Bacillus yapensis]TKS93799.1 ThiF family adenylyltransferase [Bacillus yapensis]
MINQTDIYKIRDGIDVYLIGEEILQIYFMNTRKQIQFKANKFTVLLIECIDGKKSILDIKKKLEERIEKIIDIDAIKQVLLLLVQKGIIVENKQNVHSSYISDESKERYDRQINFFGDFLPGVVRKYEAQREIENSCILIFGCGAVGGWIATELAMCGVRNFILFDGDVVEKSDITRHIYYKEEFAGIPKLDALEASLAKINPKINITKYYQYLTPETLITNVIDKADFIINTADEPYIGHTSLKISRECISQKKAHYIAGGFDAHLASTGELIIPGLTPCVDCYADYFKEALKDWKPSPHPVKERHLEIGGLSSMSLLSASYAVIEIIKYIAGLTDFTNYSKSRGEFLFDTLDINYLDVKRDENCKTCGEIVYEKA